VDGSKAGADEFEYKDMRTGEMFVGNVEAITKQLTIEVKKET
jgi:histidyl-tRNA synthetase